MNPHDDGAINGEFKQINQRCNANRASAQIDSGNCFVCYWRKYFGNPIMS